MTRRELFDLLMKCGGERRATSDEWLEPFAFAVLAHAAPKWHPVSERVPKSGQYFIRMAGSDVDLPGKIKITSAFSGDRFTPRVTHWCGPIEPPPFEEKP